MTQRVIHQVLVTVTVALALWIAVGALAALLLWMLPL